MLNYRIRAALAVGLVALLTLVGRRYLIDDSMIYFRYVRNALDGIGFVYNQGELVNALTSPLYAYLLLGMSWLLGVGHIHLAALVIFGLCTAATCLIAERDFPYAGIFIASMSYFYSLVGMETALLGLLLLLALRLFHERRLQWLPLVLTLILLTRLEAGALVPVLAWQMYRESRWPPLRSYFPAALLVAAYFFANLRLYHYLLPQSSVAKFAQGRSGYWGKWPTAFLNPQPVMHFSQGALYTMPLIFCAGLWGAWQLRKSEWFRIIVPTASIMFAFYVLFNIPPYHWYFAPFILFLILFAVHPIRSNVPGQIALLAIVAAQTIAAVFMLRAPLQLLTNYEHIATWINENTVPSATIAACDIGELGWVAQRKVIDIVGLTEPKNATHIGNHDVTSWLEEDKPDYIMVHDEPYVYEKVATISPKYERVGVHEGYTYLLRRKPASETTKP